VRDIDARDFQLVPATKFMHRAFADGESPWWNPYSAAGSYGPETLADMKLSPFVLTVAVLGASASALTFGVLLFVVIALYCLQQLVAYQLGLGRAAAIAACAVWLLTGFGASDINSATGGPYLLFPILLYALLALARRGGALRFVAALAAWVAFLLTTFVPSQSLLLVVVYAVVLIVDAPRWPAGQSPGARALTIAKRHLVVPVVAILLTAYVWLPDLAVVVHGSSSFAKYGQRSLTLTGPLSYRRRIVSPLAIAGGPLAHVRRDRAGDAIVGRGRGARASTGVAHGHGLVALFALRYTGLLVIRSATCRSAHGAQDYWAVRRRSRDGGHRRGVRIGRRGESRRGVVYGALLVVWLFGTANG
jgi:hypothetical protein